ncbi:uncharacterized protein LOC135115249 [Scylla paramamosain]|uniref:uncharacterized protein LOC135115249 n=1 Tax=Scylla paramamosain TaxID=85552 RepID=UPI003082D2F5
MKVSAVIFLLGLVATVTTAAGLPDADAGPEAVPEPIPDALPDAFPDPVSGPVPVAFPEALPEALPDPFPVALPEALPDPVPEPVLDPDASTISLSDPEGRLDPEQLDGDGKSSLTSSTFFGYEPTATTTESPPVTISTFARAHRNPRPTPTRSRILRRPIGRVRSRAIPKVDIKSIPVTFNKRVSLRDSIGTTEAETTASPEKSDQDPEKPVISPSQSVFKPRPIARTASPTGKTNKLRLVKLKPVLATRQSLSGPHSDILGPAFLSQPSVRAHRFAPSQLNLSPVPELHPRSHTFPSPSLHFPTEPHSDFTSPSLHFPGEPHHPSGLPPNSHPFQPLSLNLPSEPHHSDLSAPRHIFRQPFTPAPLHPGPVSHTNHRFAVPSEPHLASPAPHQALQDPHENSVFVSAPPDQFSFLGQPVPHSHNVPSLPSAPLPSPATKPRPKSLHQRRRKPTPSSQIRRQHLDAYILPDAHYKPKPRKVIQKTTASPAFPLHQPSITQIFPDEPPLKTPITPIAGPHADHTGHAQDPHHAHERYDVGWAVQDSHYGTHFNQQESRSDGKTKGSYSVLLPDGRLQTVSYYVDGNSGYVAKVSYSTPDVRSYGVGKDTHAQSSYAKDTYSSYTHI